MIDFWNVRYKYIYECDNCRYKFDRKYKTKNLRHVTCPHCNFYSLKEYEIII